MRDEINIPLVVEGTTSPIPTGVVENEQPEQQPDSGTRQGEAVQGGVDVGGEEPLNIDAIIENFNKQVKLGIKDSTRSSYIHWFRVFAKAVNLDKYSKTQIRGRLGKELILQYMAKKPKPSWRVLLIHLKSVWIYGLGLDFPVEPKRDIGKLPKPRRGQSPLDETVREWVRALERETDTYIKLLITIGLQFGWRPSHINRLRWEHIQYENNIPFSMYADGQVENFKTPSPIGAYLPPSIVKLLDQWRKEHPDPRPQNLILPWKGMVKQPIIDKKGKQTYQFHPQVQLNRQLPEQTISDYWVKFERKWNLPHLSPRDGRHFVATMAGRAGLRLPATALLLGHDSGSGGPMPLWYDNPQTQTLILEQKQTLPLGCLGRLGNSQPESIPAEISQLIQEYLSTEMPTRELADKLEMLRLKVKVLHP
jgi:integrase